MRGPDSTDGRAVSAIEVDFVALARLGSDLRSLAAEMSSRDGSLQGDVGDPLIHEAVRHVERDWWDQRRRLREYLESAAAAVDAAAAGYETADAAVADAASPAEPPRFALPSLALSGWPAASVVSASGVRRGGV